MQRDTPGIPSFLGSGGDFDTPGPLLFLPLLLIQGGGMDLSRVGEKLLSSVRSARSLGLLPTASDRPEVPARAAAAAAVARALAGLPPHQRIALPSSSENLVSIYGSNPQGQTVEELEDDFYQEEFDPVKYILDNIPSEDSDATYFDKQSTLRLAQLDKITERLSKHVMEHHEEMVKGMQLVMELEQDLKVANVICMNGRRHITSSKLEVSRDLVVNTKSKKKQALLDMLPILTELRRAVDMQMELDSLVEKENYFQAFALLPEYLQILDNYSELPAIQEMGRGVEAWLAKTIQKLDLHLLGICQAFKEENYITAIDAYALMGDVSGMAEKMQSFFLQEVLSQTHAVLRDVLHEEVGWSTQSRLTYSDLCDLVPESKFRLCLLRTLECLFRLMCSYYSILSFCSEEKDSEPQTSGTNKVNRTASDSLVGTTLGSPEDISSEPSVQNLKIEALESSASTSTSSNLAAGTGSMENNSPFYQLRKEATVLVANTLERGRRNLWQLTTSRLSVLLSCGAVCSTSTYQFLRNYEDLCIFILAGEAFCGVEATEFRAKLKAVCENYIVNFHRQNVYALKMVLDKESWIKMPADTPQVVSLAGLTGDGAALITHSTPSMLGQSYRRDIHSSSDAGRHKNGFANWLRIENPFSVRLEHGSRESSPRYNSNGGVVELWQGDKASLSSSPKSLENGSGSVLEDENEDLLADFIDEDSQLPSRISNSRIRRGSSAQWIDEEISAQTGSSLCLLRLMDKYARLMQKLEIVNVELFKGLCQLFGTFFHFMFESFGQPGSQNVKSTRLRTALSKITQDCDQWIRPQSNNSPTSSISYNPSFSHMDVMPTVPLGHTSFVLKERCIAAETLSLVARVLNRSRPHLQSMLQNRSSVVENFFVHLVDSVPDLIEHIHKTSARMLLHMSGYIDKITNAKWEVKELGLEHNGYVDLLLGEFKHYKTRLSHEGISKEVQDMLLDYGVESIVETLIEGLSRVKRCTDEGRALMSLDLQVLMNGLKHFVPGNVKPKFQIVEVFIKAYYLPETEYVHWARAHPEYSKSQVIGLVNLVATMKGWKRKTRLEVIDKIEFGP
ncbi:coiled-coil domain-containing protein 132 [Carex littledalei]|uniref:Coiled-coil domain-containing protein 132 n=1 Tax=Carex littledalei TaxID=544730 RepID=A0A833QJK9_9POAL|nr:coiled-coil domain-containing protein 132 [Carex littledalei]